MEFEVVEVKVPKGMVCRGKQLSKCNLMIVPSRRIHAGETHLASIFGTPGFVFVACNPKPDWKPPKMKNGWVTWDESGWQWWPMVPRAKSSDGWLNPETGGADDSYYFDKEMTELLGMPDCAGYEWSDCIWEVGE